MRGKFALMLCPTPKCPKVGLSKDARCPEHDEAMVRTVVMTEAYVAQHNKLNEAFSQMASKFGMR